MSAACRCWMLWGRPLGAQGLLVSRGPWRRAGGCRPGDLGRQAEMRQDAARHLGSLDERDEAQAAATARTRQHVDIKCPAHQRRPRHVRRGGCRWLCRVDRSRVVRWGRGWSVRDDFCSPCRPRRQHAVVEHEVHPGTRHKHRQSFEKRGGRKREMRGAVGPRASQLQHHVPVVRHAEPLSRHRRPQRVSGIPVRAAPGAQRARAPPRAGRSRPIGHGMQTRRERPAARAPP